VKKKKESKKGFVFAEGAPQLGIRIWAGDRREKKGPQYGVEEGIRTCPYVDDVAKNQRKENKPWDWNLELSLLKTNKKGGEMQIQTNLKNGGMKQRRKKRRDQVFEEKGS